ncbi:MAG: hypothetical protein ACYDDF_12370 [Thermoplasmatota archaeon]
MNRFVLGTLIGLTVTAYMVVGTPTASATICPASGCCGAATCCTTTFCCQLTSCICNNSLFTCACTGIACCAFNPAGCVPPPPSCASQPTSCIPPIYCNVHAGEDTVLAGANVNCFSGNAYVCIDPAYYGGPPGFVCREYFGVTWGPTLP